MTETKPIEEKKLTFEEVKAKLSPKEIVLLGQLKTFPQLDKGSQNRLRAKVDAQRKANKHFEMAFEMSIGSIMGQPTIVPVKSKFQEVIDVMTHPITAIKGKIGEKMLKKRNEAPKIRLHPDPVLKQVAEPWDFTKEKKEDLIEIVRKMGASLRETPYGDRLGIAAPQIGISKRIMVCQGAVCVNPEWKPPSHDQRENVIEGCYSVPHRLFDVSRSRYGWASWYSIDGERREYKLKGIDAIVFQHELDHLDGKCCVDIGVERIRPKKEDAPKEVEAPKEQPVA